MNVPKKCSQTVHPGLVLKDELEEIGVTQSQFASHIGPAGQAQIVK